MDRLKLKTRESLYPPVEIEIDEVVYKHKKLTREFLTELAAIEERIGEKDKTATADWIVAMYGDMKPEVLAALDAREVEDIYLYCTRKLQAIEKERFNREVGERGEKKDPPPQPEKTFPRKNATRPGVKKSS